MGHPQVGGSAGRAAARQAAAESELLPFVLAWAEWLLVLFYMFARLICGLTLVSSIHTEKDEQLMREVSNRAKVGFWRFR